jgi:hypothetical protein
MKPVTKPFMKMTTEELLQAADQMTYIKDPFVRALVKALKNQRQEVVEELQRVYDN